ncbi:hypothetical protein ABZ356_13045 [Micromonospora zamorensis]|uniref:hypothetical protein n=1 Tax=Micromonospora zamorensis TaxID=709883 RepID=UPI0033C5B64B
MLVIGSQSVLGSIPESRLPLEATASMEVDVACFNDPDDKLVLVESQSTQPGRGYTLEPHDCVVSKLVAGREKDHAFANALIRAGLIDPAVAAERIELVDVDTVVLARLKGWIAMYLPAT